MTVADVQGREYVRSQTPEYVRLVEMGVLRAFVDEVTLVTGFFSGFMGLIAYWFGHLIGRYTCWPATVFLKRI